MLRLNRARCSLTLVLGLGCALASACKRDKVDKPQATVLQPQSNQASSPRAPILGDGEITAAVETSLYRDPGVSPADIHVTTTDGIVELTGSAGNLLTKRRAVRVAEAVKGVRAVSERLELKLTDRPDQDLKNQVESTLLLDTAVQSKGVKVTVRGGIVTLTGGVPSYQQRDLCQWLTEGVGGVREVENHLHIEQRVARTDAEISSDVESRLRWDALVNHGLIEVSVRDAVVSLRGQVASAAERRRAASDAWVRGAERVDDTGLQVHWWAKEHDLKKDQLLGKSDASIAEAIRDAAAYDPRVSAANLQIAVDGGAVTLGGSVASVGGRFAAEDLAYNTVGVTEVKNELSVKPTKPVADTLILRAVRGALLWNPHTNAFDIDAQVKRGVVTLTGEVNTAFERATATDVTSRIAGVTDINNEIKVKRPDAAYVYVPYYYPYGPYWGRGYYTPTSTSRTDAQIARDIRDELKWSPFVDAAQVNVTVEHGRALLTGEVNTPSARAAATRNAYEGGAVQVENHLTVGG